MKKPAKTKTTKSKPIVKYPSVNVQIIAPLLLGAVIFTGIGYFLGQSKTVEVKNEPTNQIVIATSTPIIEAESSVSPTVVPELAKKTTSTLAQPVLVNGASVRDIKYTLPTGWEAKIENNNIFFSPKQGGGYLSLTVQKYDGNSGRREYYCKLTQYCMDGVTYFEEITLGNISGYTANALDNSGGGREYFGAKGDKFYIIATFTPPSPNEFERGYQKVLDSLVF